MLNEVRMYIRYKYYIIQLVQNILVRWIIHQIDVQFIVITDRNQQTATTKT